eukprot:jgi/Tetstr1/458117/TSEL_004285.t2
MALDAISPGPCLTPAELRLLLDSVVALPGGVKAELPATSEPDVSELYDLISTGRWEAALQLPVVLSVLAIGECLEQAGEGADEAVLAAGRAAAVAAFQASEGRSREVLVLLGAAVALLNLFMEANFSGPPAGMARLPADIFTNQPAVAVSVPEAAVRERAGAKQLVVDGEELVGKLSSTHCLLLASALLLAPLSLPGAADGAAKEGAAVPSTWTPCASWLLWALRAVSAHQRVVSRRSATLRARQRALSSALLVQWGDPDWALKQVDHACAGSETAARPWFAPLLSGCCLMELAALEDLYGDNSIAAQRLAAAGEALGLRLELTGVMGKRTVHQVDGVAQMVARVSRTGMLAEVASLESAAAAEEQLLREQQPRPVAQAASTLPKEMKWQESSDGLDVMEMPKLEVDSSSLGLDDLTSVEQSLLLQVANHEKKREALDEELQMWRMAPFVEAVIGQRCADFCVRLAGQLMRGRHEFVRSRTKQRGFLRFQDVVDNALNVDGGSSTARVRGIHATPAPCLPGIRHELAKKMISIGLVGEAMRLLEELELWDSMIVCYQTMDKKLQALEVIKHQLEERPDEPSLLCALGDVTGEEQPYHDAWEKSGKRSARAMRSLADSAHRKKDFAAAAAYWEAALALNPLHASGWFALGHSFLKVDKLDKAVHAFTRCCQLDASNGAAWNNVAAICLTQKKHKEAFAALAESSKYLRENWHTWDNYVQVAVLLGNFSAVLHGIHHMMRLRHGKDIPLEALSAVVRYLEHPGEGETANNVQLMLGRVEACLKAIAQVGGSEAAFWRIFARYHALRGQRTVERECLLKCTRGLTGDAWQQDETRFLEVADASAALAEATLACVQGGACGRRELAQARLQLRGVLKQAEAEFEEHEACSRLRGVLERVQQREGELRAEEDGGAASAQADGGRSIRDSLRDC